jgi:SAM-dependent methyltransferase
MGQSLNNISYSVRRHYVDDFFEKNISIFIPGTEIIDLGGKKINKRGDFDINNYNLNVKYANLSEDSRPDFLCDISSVPVDDNSFDGAILSEVIEHLPEPKRALEEAFRILKPGGYAMICAPFNFHIHADPYDYGRYTGYWYETALKEIGFIEIKIEKQGLFFSVMANMLKLWAHEWQKAAKPKSAIKRKLFHKFVFWFQKKAFIWEKRDYYKNNWLFSGYTTGYGIICKKG